MSKFRYLVVSVDEKLADRVAPGDIMVDRKRHESDGWTSWMFHSMEDQSNSVITALKIGKLVETGAEKGTPEFADFLDSVARQVADLGDSPEMADPDVAKAWRKCYADCINAATEARAALV